LAPFETQCNLKVDAGGLVMNECLRKGARPAEPIFSTASHPEETVSNAAAWPIQSAMPTFLSPAWIGTLWRGERGWWRTYLHLVLLGLVFAVVSLIHPLTTLAHRAELVPAAFSLKCLFSSALNGWRHHARFRVGYGFGIVLVAVGLLGYLLILWFLAQGLMLLYG
jgi:hypothetical protein